MGAEIVALQGEGGVAVDVEGGHDERGHPPVNLIEQPRSGRIQGVVQVEHPGVDMIQRRPVQVGLQCHRTDKAVRRWGGWGMGHGQCLLAVAGSQCIIAAAWMIAVTLSLP